MAKSCRQGRFFGLGRRRSNADSADYKLDDLPEPDNDSQKEDPLPQTYVIHSTRHVNRIWDVTSGEVLIDGLSVCPTGANSELQYFPLGILAMNERQLLDDIPSLESYIRTDREWGVRFLDTEFLDMDILQMVLLWDAYNGTTFPRVEIISRRNENLFNQKRFAQLYFLARKLDIPRLQERAKDLFLENFNQEKRVHIPILDFIWINTSHGDGLREGILNLAIKKQASRIGEFNLASPVPTTEWITPEYIESKFYRGGLKLPTFEPRSEPNTMFKDDLAARILVYSSSEPDQRSHPLPPSIHSRRTSLFSTRQRVSVGAKVRDKFQTLKYLISGRKTRDKNLQEELRLHDKMMIEDEKAHRWDSSHHRSRAATIQATEIVSVPAISSHRQRNSSLSGITV